MDPHSTHSQFNQRTPKSGPFSPAVRFIESKSKISLEKYAKHPSSKAPRSDAQSADALDLLMDRPISTNSRVKQDEKFKRDMYIAFINKALQGKLDVRLVSCSLTPADLACDRVRARISMTL